VSFPQEASAKNPVVTTAVLAALQITAPNIFFHADHMLPSRLCGNATAAPRVQRT